MIKGIVTRLEGLLSNYLGLSFIPLAAADSSFCRQRISAGLSGQPDRNLALEGRFGWMEPGTNRLIRPEPGAGRTGGSEIGAGGMAG